MSEITLTERLPGTRPPFELVVFVASLLAAVALAVAPHRVGLF